jgi:hypothetical protein
MDEITKSHPGHCWDSIPGISLLFCRQYLGTIPIHLSGQIKENTMTFAMFYLCGAILNVIIFWIAMKPKQDKKSSGTSLVIAFILFWIAIMWPAIDIVMFLGWLLA